MVVRERRARGARTSGTGIDERLIVAYDELGARLRDFVRGRRLPLVNR